VVVFSRFINYANVYLTFGFFVYNNKKAFLLGQVIKKMGEIVIYDSAGIPTFRILRNGRIVDFNGLSIGFIFDTHVYDYNGNHRGFFEEGILRDHDGFVVGYSDSVTSPVHPPFPLRQLLPPRLSEELEPLRPFLEIAPLKPLGKYEWSSITPYELFVL